MRHVCATLLCVLSFLSEPICAQRHHVAGPQPRQNVTADPFLPVTGVEYDPEVPFSVDAVYRGTSGDRTPRMAADGTPQVWVWRRRFTAAAPAGEWCVMQTLNVQQGAVTSATLNPLLLRAGDVLLVEGWPDTQVTFHVGDRKLVITREINRDYSTPVQLFGIWTTGECK